MIARQDMARRLACQPLCSAPAEPRYIGDGALDEKRSEVRGQKSEAPLGGQQPVRGLAVRRRAPIHRGRPPGLTRDPLRPLRLCVKLFLMTRRQDAKSSKAVSRCACYRTPKGWRFGLRLRLGAFGSNPKRCRRCACHRTPKGRRFDQRLRPFEIDPGQPADA